LNKVTRTLYYRDADEEFKNYRYYWLLPEGTLVSSYDRDSNTANRPLKNDENYGIEIRIPRKYATANGKPGAPRTVLHLSFSDTAKRDNFYETLGREAAYGVIFSSPVQKPLAEPKKKVQCSMCGQNETQVEELACKKLYEKYIADGKRFFSKNLKPGNLEYFFDDEFQWMHFRETATNIREKRIIFPVPVDECRVNIDGDNIKIGIFSDKPLTLTSVRKWNHGRRVVPLDDHTRRILENCHHKISGPTKHMGVTTQAAGVPGASAQRRLATTVTQLPQSCTEPSMSPTILYTSLASVGFLLGGFLIYQCLRRARQPKRDSFGSFQIPEGTL